MPNKNLKKRLAEEVAETAKAALKQLVSKGHLPWPDVYSEEFWKVAKSKNLNILPEKGGAYKDIDVLQDFAQKADDLLGNVKDTIEKFLKETKEHVSDMQVSLKNLDEKDKENLFYEDIAKLILKNKTLEHKARQTEKKIQEQARTIENLRARLRIDPLTDLFNRHALESDLRKELAKIKRYNYPISLIMCDIDHFKDINDTYGHQVGDKILKKLSKLWKLEIRETDSIYRYGGEEFLIIAPHTTKKEAIKLAERLRKTVKKYKFVIKPPEFFVKLTVSFGVTDVKPGERVEQVLKRVDRALYSAKNAGRDNTLAL